MPTTSQNLTSQEIKELLKSHADPPRWTMRLLEFAEQDLETFKGKDWEKLGKDLKDLLESSYDLARLWKGPQARPRSEFLDRLRKGFPKELKDRTCLKAIQSQLREALNALLPDTLNNISFHVGHWKVPIEGLTFEMESAVVEKGKRSRTRKTRIGRIYRAGWPGIFWLVVADLLEQQGNRLHRCAQCRKLYLKFKRQAFCTKQCGQQQRTRRYYEEHHEELREKRHEYYVKKMKRIHGKDIQIRRNRPVIKK